MIPTNIPGPAGRHGRTAGQDAWEQFTQTGKIQDYLAYRRDQQQQAFQTAQTKGNVTPHAADNRRDHPAGL